MSKSRCADRSSLSSPNVIQPNERTLTSMPLRPSARYFISASRRRLVLRCGWTNQRFIAARKRPRDVTYRVGPITDRADGLHLVRRTRQEDFFSGIELFLGDVSLDDGEPQRSCLCDDDPTRDAVEKAIGDRRRDD